MFCNIPLEPRKNITNIQRYMIFIPFNRYASLQGELCSCGDLPNQTQTEKAAEDCDTKCTDYEVNSTRTPVFCGSEWDAVSVYSSLGKNWYPGPYSRAILNKIFLSLFSKIWNIRNDTTSIWLNCQV